MSSTNVTTHYSLPSFLGSDKPSWLVDWNGAMAAIDTAIYEAKTVADGAASAAATNAANITTLSSTVSGQGTDLTTLSAALTTLTGTVNTITSLIGNGEPTTTDKTLIGAINELHTAIIGIGTSKLDIDRGSVSVIADGVKTWGELLDELALLVNFSKVSQITTLITITATGDKYVRLITDWTSASLIFVRNIATGSGFKAQRAVLHLNGSDSGNDEVECAVSDDSISYTNKTTDVPASGIVIKVLY